MIIANIETLINESILSSMGITSKLESILSSIDFSTPNIPSWIATGKKQAEAIIDKLGINNTNGSEMIAAAKSKADSVVGNMPINDEAQRIITAIKGEMDSTNKVMDLVRYDVNVAISKIASEAKSQLAWIDKAKTFAVDNLSTFKTQITTYFNEFKSIPSIQKVIEYAEQYPTSFYVIVTAVPFIMVGGTYSILKRIKNSKQASEEINRLSASLENTTDQKQKREIIKNIAIVGAKAIAIKKLNDIK